MFRLVPLLLAVVCLQLTPQVCQAEPRLKALIVDGQNTRSMWPKTTVMMKRSLESTGRFDVDVAPLGHSVLFHCCLAVLSYSSIVADEIPGVGAIGPVKKVETGFGLQVFDSARKHLRTIAIPEVPANVRYVSEFEVATLAKQISGSSASIEGRISGPKHQIVSDKIRDLGMSFGGEQRLKQTVTELVKATS